jgi:predicted O-methyltransferase YrrM
MFSRELDILECRLIELEAIRDLRHVLVEAHVDHQDHPKPLFYAENRERFARWADRIVHVVADKLPTAAEAPDPWAREHAQREYVRQGLSESSAAPDDIVLHGDVDEVPTAVAARNVRPRGFVAFDMRCFSMAVDWQHPDRWRGTVASRVGNVRSFGAMRDARNFAPALPNAGWHLGWLGGREANLAKLGSFCHPEIAERTQAGLEADRFYVEGWHVDMRKLKPVDVDQTWPRWIAERHCPDNWFRPRFTEDWFSDESCAALADLARRTDGVAGDVVEVGSWEGRSTIALANACRPARVVAVDTWAGSPGEVSSTLAAGRDVFATFERNIRLCTAGNVDVQRRGWRDYFAGRTGPLRFVFIDAEHTYREVADNIAAVLPLLESGGIVCGDDVHHPPVQQAVLEAFPDAQRTASLWWWQKP